MTDGTTDEMAAPRERVRAGEGAGSPEGATPGPRRTLSLIHI